MMTDLVAASMQMFHRTSFDGYCEHVSSGARRFCLPASLDLPFLCRRLACSSSSSSVVRVFSSLPASSLPPLCRVGRPKKLSLPGLAFARSNPRLSLLHSPTLCPIPRRRLRPLGQRTLFSSHPLSTPHQRAPLSPPLSPLCPFIATKKPLSFTLPCSRGRRQRGPSRPIRSYSKKRVAQFPCAAILLTQCVSVTPAVHTPPVRVLPLPSRSSTTWT